MKFSTFGGKLHIYIPREKIEQWICEKLFNGNEPMNDVFIRCNSAEVAITLNESDKAD